MHSKGDSRAYRLEPGESAADGMRRIAAGRAESALKRLRGIDPEEPGFADAIHGARKDLKKLRAVVRLLRDELGDAYEAENHRYRDAARILSASRDAQVKLETLEALGERAPATPFAIWIEALRSERDRSLREFDQMAAFEAIEMIEAGRDRIGAWRLALSPERLLGAGVRRVYARGRRAMRAADREASEESFHRWRKRAKDVWYVLRIFHDAWPEVLGPTAEQAHALGDLLGAHHDLAVLREDLAARSFPAERNEPLLAAILDREEELAADAFELGSRIYAERPKPFARRLGAYWSAWRDVRDPC